MRCAAQPAARSPYVRLRSLAYVTGRGPRGSIGSPSGRGAEPYMMGSRHVPAPDPCLAFGQGLSIFPPSAPRPRRERSGPLAKGSSSHLRGPSMHTWRSRTSHGILVRKLRRTPMGGPDLLQMPRGIPPRWTRGGPGPTQVVRPGAAVGPEQPPLVGLRHALVIDTALLPCG
jgi:hypothetical protein